MQKYVVFSPIRKARSTFDGITSNLSIMRRAYVALILSATAFSMAWYKIVIQRSLVVYHGISYMPAVFLVLLTLSPNASGVYQENTSDSWDIPWYTTRNRCITRMCFIQFSVVSLQVVCIIIAALLQYFFIAMFCWALCEGLQLFMTLSTGKNKKSTRLKYFFIIGWSKFKTSFALSLDVTMADSS